MKIVFAGTPEFSIEPLKALVSAGADVRAVLTRADKPQGRKGILTPPPLKVAAQALGIPVIQTETPSEALPALRELGVDCMITCAYGRILTQETLDFFPLGVWNIHASLLPAYRGAAPIARTIMDGEKETGVTIMKTDIGIDTGDMLLRAACKIEDSDTCGTLTDKLSKLGGALIVKAVALLEQGGAELEKQGEGFVCKKVRHEVVDFSGSAAEVSRFIRGLSPAPLAFATVGALTLNFLFAEECEWGEDALYGTVLSDNPKDGLVVKCGTGAVRITQLQPAGGKVMSARDFMNGRKISKGQRFE